MTRFLIGETIKSFDFPGRTDCYITGTITDIDAARGLYFCDIIEAVSEDKVYDMGEPSFCTPISGFMDDMFEGGRIQLVNQQAQGKL